MYSFQDAGLFLALSFFPVSESKTNIRYDLFARSTVSEPNIRQMSETLQSATKKLTEEIELEYQSISARQWWVLYNILCPTGSVLILQLGLRASSIAQV
jgi:hypothetical protein